MKPSLNAKYSVLKSIDIEVENGCALRGAINIM